MRLSEVFNDLGEFVRQHRGRISREGLLLCTNTTYEAGTVLDIDIRLADGLALVVGQAGVVHVRSGSPDSDRAWAVVLQWVDLDDDSASLLDRIEAREAAEGVAPFRLDSVLPPPAGPIRERRIWPHAAAEPLSEEGEDKEQSPEPTRVAIESTEELGELVTSALGASTLPPTQHGRDRRASSGRRTSSRKSGSLGNTLRWVVGLGAVAVIVTTVALLWLPSASDNRRSTAAGAGSSAVPTAHRTSLPTAAPAADGTSVPTAVSTMEGRTTPSASPSGDEAHELSPTATKTRRPAPPNPAVTAAHAAIIPAPDPTPMAATSTAADFTASPSPSARPTPADGPAASPAALVIDISADGDATVITITTDVAVASERVLHGRLESPPGPREVVRILGIASCSIEPRIDVAGSHLAAVRTWLHDELEPAELHVVLDLADASVHADPPQIVGHTVRIRLTR